MFFGCFFVLVGFLRALFGQSYLLPSLSEHLICHEHESCHFHAYHLWI